MSEEVKSDHIELIKALQNIGHDLRGALSVISNDIGYLAAKYPSEDFALSKRALASAVSLIQCFELCGIRTDIKETTADLRAAFKSHGFKIGTWPSTDSKEITASSVFFVELVNACLKGRALIDVEACDDQETCVLTVRFDDTAAKDTLSLSSEGADTKLTLLCLIAGIAGIRVLRDSQSITIGIPYR
jgi:hypothetical protein